ncbi:MAG: efflux RND transporter periplasmic adaptor subunit [Verrucomicrobiota bacterium]
MKKILIVVILLGLLGTGGWYFWSAYESSQSATAESGRATFAVVSRTIRENIEATGIVEPKVSTEVRSEISGRIESIFVEEGDEVERGQPLIELDRITLQNELTEAERNLQSFQLRLEQAERNFLRLQKLSQQEFARESELEDAETEFALAQLDLEVRETRVETARDNLDKATILAPQAGVISNLDVNEGQVIVGATSVNQGTLLMNVNDLSELIVRSSVNEVDVMRISEKTEVLISFDSIPDLTIEGDITEISRFGRADNSVRVFPIEVTFPADDSRLRSGITANLFFPLAEVTDVPAVLISAVFNIRGKQTLVVLMENGEYEMREVTTGLSDTEFVQILEGASLGDEVSLTRPPGIERMTRPIR